MNLLAAELVTTGRTARTLAGAVDDDAARKAGTGPALKSIIDPLKRPDSGGLHRVLVILILAAQ
jgi:hypothetical protein